jgi:hypothetical protein
MSEIKTIYLVKPKLNKYRWIAGEKLEKWPPLKDSEFFAVSEPEYLGKFPNRRDIEVLPANSGANAEFSMREEIGMAVINPRGITQIVS